MEQERTILASLEVFDFSDVERVIAGGMDIDDTGYEIGYRFIDSSGARRAARVNSGFHRPTRGAFGGQGLMVAYRRALFAIVAIIGFSLHPSDGEVEAV
jgi:hypothetical protein